MQVTIVHSPTAGDGTHGRDWLIHTAQSYGHDVQYFESKDERWRSAQADADLIAVAGGDGSVGEVARSIARSSALLTILPLGTANNVATKLSLVGRPLESLMSGWADGQRSLFDIGVATGRWGEVRFVESVGIGLLAETIAEIDTGSASYVNDLAHGQARVNAAFDLLCTRLKTCEPTRVRLVIDGTDVSGEYLMVEVMNFGAAGPNLHLSPDAEPGDGLLDVVLIGESERTDLVRKLDTCADLASAFHALPVHTAKRVTLSCEQGVMHVDDQLSRLGSPETGVDVDMGIETGVITMLVPR
jgi:diacylglycerol kinase family enzyme